MSTCPATFQLDVCYPLTVRFLLGGETRTVVFERAVVQAKLDELARRFLDGKSVTEDVTITIYHDQAKILFRELLRERYGAEILVYVVMLA